VGGTRRHAHPLAANGLLLYPNLGEPISSRAAEEAGANIGGDSVPARHADTQGRLLAAGRLASTAFPPGEYELHAIVKGGAEPIVRTTTMTVVE